MITIAEAARERGMNLRHLQQLCKARRVPGAKLIGRMWMLPAGWSVTPGARGPKLRQ